MDVGPCDDELAQQYREPGGKSGVIGVCMWGEPTVYLLEELGVLTSKEAPKQVFLHHYAFPCDSIVLWSADSNLCPC